MITNHNEAAAPRTEVSLLQSVSSGRHRADVEVEVADPWPDTTPLAASHRLSILSFGPSGIAAEVKRRKHEFQLACDQFTRQHGRVS